MKIDSFFSSSLVTLSLLLASAANAMDNHLEKVPDESSSSVSSSPIGQKLSEGKDVPSASVAASSVEAKREQEDDDVYQQILNTYQQIDKVQKSNAILEQKKEEALQQVQDLLKDPEVIVALQKRPKLLAKQQARLKKKEEETLQKITELFEDPES